jgi:hypothetical protein
VSHSLIFTKSTISSSKIVLYRSGLTCVDMRTCFSKHMTPVVDYFNLRGDASSTTHCQLSYDKKVMWRLQKLCCERFSKPNDTSLVSDWHLERLWFDSSQSLILMKSSTWLKEVLPCLLTIVQGRLFSLEGAVKTSRSRLGGRLSWGGFIFRGLYKGYIRSGYVTSSRI